MEGFREVGKFGDVTLLTNEVGEPVCESEFITKITFGKKDERALCEKVILLVGGKYVGKTALVNNMYNYLFKIRRDSPNRLAVSPIHTGDLTTSNPTTHITAYTFYHNRDAESGIPYPVTIIDTPGLSQGTTEGNEMVFHLFRILFSQKVKRIVGEIDALAFVVQASMTRLTDDQTNICGMVRMMFNRSLYLLITSADATAEPPVLRNIQGTKLNIAGDFKVDNSVLYKAKNPGSAADKVRELLWDMGESSFDAFFRALATMGLNGSPVCLEKEFLESDEEMDRLVSLAERQIVDMEKCEKDIEQLKNETESCDKQSETQNTGEPTGCVSGGTVVNKIRTKDGTQQMNCEYCLVTCSESKEEWDFRPERTLGIHLKLFLGLGQDSYYCKKCPSQCSRTKHKLGQYYYADTTTPYTNKEDDLNDPVAETHQYSIEKKEEVDKTRKEEMEQSRNAMITALLKTFDGMKERSDLSQELSIPCRFRADPKILETVHDAPNPKSIHFREALQRLLSNDTNCS